MSPTERRRTMSITADCHIHSHHSGDSEVPMEDMVKRAIALGLERICFTEHQDFDFVYEPGEPKDLFETDTDAYYKELACLREKYKKQIKILFGIELGLQTHISDRLDTYAASYDFDFIIGSSHLCNHKDPYLKSFFEDRSEMSAYREYFSYINECIAACHNFDVYGHLDYVLRYGPTTNTQFHFKDYQDLIDPILRSLIMQGKGIELNTSGYAYHLSAPHPCHDILKRYRELGGEILTIGSDSHKPEQIAAYFSTAADLLTGCGFTHYCVFEQRKPVFYSL